MDESGVDSGHFIYKLLCKLRREARPFSSRVVIKGVREAAPKLTEKEKQIQHALGLLAEYDIVVYCRDLTKLMGRNGYRMM